MRKVQPMQIRNILAGQSEAALLGKRSEQAEPGSGRSLAAQGALPAAGRGLSTAAAAVLAEYDVTDITPSQFSEMLQRLHEAGALTREEFHELTAARLDLEASGVKPDDRIDLVEFYRQRVSRFERRLADAESPQSARQELQTTRRRLDWIEKFAVVQADPDAAGLNELV